MYGRIARFSVPINVIHGFNSLRLVGEEAKKLKATKVSFVTDAGVKGAGVLDEAFQSLSDAKISFQLFDQAPVDPTTLTIAKVASELKESGCDCVVTAGAGSSLCTGTGAALMATNPGNIRDYAGIEKYPNPPLPCIAIPTTAGSGREVSKATVVTDERTNRKIVIIGHSNTPVVAILDPIVLRSVPKGQAVASGVDALTHAVEGYCGRRATPLSDAIALAAIEIITQNILPSILGDDLEAKSRMLLASSMANIACGEGGLGLSHNMNGAITFTFKSKGYPAIPYGLIHAICLPIVLEFNLPTCEAKFGATAKAMGIAESKGSQAELGRRMIERMKEILVALDAPRRLPWENVPKEHLGEMANLVLAESAEYPNPRSYDQQDIIGLFDRILVGWDKY